MLDPDKNLELVKEAWIVEQDLYRSKVSDEDPVGWCGDTFSYLGGLDISFIIGDDINACACYVVVDKNLEVVYKDTKMVKMSAPYIPGFLAFREARFLVELVDAQKASKPEITPQVRGETM